MTTTQVPSPDTPGRLMYLHEIRPGDFAFILGEYHRVLSIDVAPICRVVCDDVIRTVTHEHDMVEVVR